MLSCLVKSMLNKWDSVPFVLGVRAKERLIVLALEPFKTARFRDDVGFKIKILKF